MSHCEGRVGEAGYFKKKKVTPILCNSMTWGKSAPAQETVSRVTPSEYLFREAVCLRTAAPGYCSQIPCAEATPFTQAGPGIMHSSSALAPSCRYRLQPVWIHLSSRTTPGIDCKIQRNKAEGETPIVHVYAMHPTDLPVFWESYRMH